MSIFQNTCKPVGFFGKVMLSMMNIGHSKLHKWGFTQLKIKKNSVNLDIGCGGGSNVKRILDMNKSTTAYGIDYSLESVKKSKKKCKKYIKSNRCFITMMDVNNLEFFDNTFDLVTAFETVYFWKDLEKTFFKIYNILKNGGEFFICNESNGSDPSDEKWCKKINGMKIYKTKELVEILKKVGFLDIKVNETNKTWVSILAKKEFIK